MNWFPSISAVFAAATVVLCRASMVLAQADSNLKVEFGDKGLSSIQLGGQELLAAGEMSLPKFDLRENFPPTPLKTIDMTPEVSFDATAKKLTQKYDWGSFECVYGVQGDKLTMDLTLRNTTAKNTIFGFTLQPLRLKLPGEIKTRGWAHGWPSPSILNDAPMIFDVSWDAGSIAICNEEVDRPMWIGLPKAGDAYAVEIKVEGPPRGPEIVHEDWREFHVSIRFGAKGSSSLQLATDIYKKFAERYPSELKWDDRRPIGCNFLSSIESRSETNPTGWLHDSTINMSTDAGRADWKKRMLARADKSVEVAKAMGCQGVITWDIEGQRNPHNISYIGDPRLLPTLSPEMDAIADEYFKKYTDAGLRPGVTLRPTHVVRTPGGKNQWEHVGVEDIVAEIAGKLDYAKKRWGCTLFYIDSTMRWDQDEQGNYSLKVLPAEIFQSLHRMFPDVLLINEQSTTRHHAYAAPYHEVMPPHNFAITPPEVRAVYPNAFSVIRVADIPVIEKNFDALVEGVKSGDIIVFRTWLDDPDNVPVKKILEKAGKL